MSPFILRRLVQYGHGFHPFGRPSDADLERVRNALRDAGRDPAQIEIVGGIRPRFPDASRPADLDEAAASIPDQVAAGYTAICFNPSQYVDEIAEVPAICRRLVALTSRAG